MSFFDLEVLNRKPIKSKGIMSHLKLFKKYDFVPKNLKNKIKITTHITYENMVKF
jgi:hypothetical protein